MSDEIPSFIPSSNGVLHDFEITYRDNSVPFSSVATETHVVRASKSIKNALVSFHRAVPTHGPIKRIRKVVSA
jgi:hypothetical protein